MLFWSSVKDPDPRDQQKFEFLYPDPANMRSLTIPLFYNVSTSFSPKRKKYKRLNIRFCIKTNVKFYKILYGLRFGTGSIFQVWIHDSDLNKNWILSTVLEICSLFTYFLS